MIATASKPSLRLVRLPSEFGPVVRCSGDLVRSTVHALQRELSLLEPLAHPVVILNLCDCSSLDAEGVMAILQSYKRRRERGRQLVVVACPGPVAHVLQLVHFERVVPVFRSEAAVAASLRGDSSPAAPSSWSQSLAEAIVHWRTIERGLERATPDEIVRLLTSRTALCRRSEELFQRGSIVAVSHCELCPLFHQLGGRPENAGCMSTLAPIIAATRAGDRRAARSLVQEAVHTLEGLRAGDA